MDNPFIANNYFTPSRKIPWFNRKFPSLAFWSKMFHIVWKCMRLAKKGKYPDKKWIESSIDFLHSLESVGVRFEVENIDILRNQKTPVVFIGNHMSTLETFILPSIIQPLMEVTFVVKKALVEHPFFKDIMLSRDPIVVGRKNPRDDFKVVMEEGKKRLTAGISVIIFPQTTRSATFDPEQFNSIGIKLAKHANATIIPIALKTDAWSNGKIIKDIGKIDPSKTVHVCFGEPIQIKGRGKEEHEQIVKFIVDKFPSW